jgi:hypothetical protein
MSPFRTAPHPADDVDLPLWELTRTRLTLRRQGAARPIPELEPGLYRGAHPVPLSGDEPASSTSDASASAMTGSSKPAVRPPSATRAAAIRASRWRCAAWASSVALSSAIVAARPRAISPTRLRCAAGAGSPPSCPGPERGESGAV